jgi:hypothetical protein
VATHQQNHAHLTHLRALTATLTTHLTTTLTTLSATRTAILNTPLLPPPSARTTPAAHILAYARNNARHQPTAAPAAAADPPPPPTPTNPGLATLTGPEKGWLDAPGAGTRLPWPDEETVRRGALARLQLLAEAGVEVLDAGSVEAAVGRLGLDGAADEGAVGMEMEVGMENGDGGGAAGVAAAGVGMGAGPGPDVGRREEKPRVFGGYDLYDPDDEMAG